MDDCNRRPTQAEKVLEYIIRHGSITTLDAFSDLGIARLSARIFELKKSGINIVSENITVRNRFGEKTRVTEYRLA